MMKRRLIIILAVFFAFASIAYAEDRNPAQLIEGFFELIQKGQVNQAYDLLFTGSSIPASKPQAVQVLKTQTSSGLPLYGGVIGFEKIHEEKIGESIRRYVYVLKSELGPTAWEFYFYKPKTSWFLQFHTLLDRNLRNQWRDRSVLFGRFITFASLCNSFFFPF